MVRYKWLMLGLVLMLALATGAYTSAAPDPGVEQFLKDLYGLRSRALVTGEATTSLDGYYDLSSQSGRFAMAHEIGRVGYMQAWASARRLRITDSEVLVTNLRVKVTGNSATVSLIARTRLGYQYEGKSGLSHMGIGSWHWLQLNRKNGNWQVSKEFYLDALGDEWTQPYVPASARDDALSVMAEADRVSVLAPEATSAAARRGLDRQGAVAYAEKYCGAAWGCGNNANYNERYQSYRNLGGDCANFASQVLTEGGKLKPDWLWRSQGKGSTCWVNAHSFVRYLLGSGRASLLARGTYPKVEPALSKLKPGDIVGYQSSKGITHVSVVTGNDSGGLPVVAAHTADRFRNPWDLGWDRDTVFWLLHLHE